MISHLSGIILEKNERHIVLDVHGVGYKVFAATSFLETTKKNAPCALFIHTAVREDDISLYGFSTKEALAFFELLISVTRIGPKLALDIMEVPMNNTKLAIVKKDIDFLGRIPGIGRKTAERIILELFDKIKQEAPEEGAIEKDEIDMSPDIIEALIKLGYQRPHIINILKQCPKETKDEKAVIQYFLQHA